VGNFNGYPTCPHFSRIKKGSMYHRANFPLVPRCWTICRPNSSKPAPPLGRWSTMDRELVQSTVHELSPQTFQYRNNPKILENLRFLQINPSVPQKLSPQTFQYRNNSKILENMIFLQINPSVSQISQFDT
jgi:hypothetical protein